MPKDGDSVVIESGWNMILEPGAGVEVVEFILHFYRSWGGSPAGNGSAGWD